MKKIKYVFTTLISAWVLLGFCKVGLCAELKVSKTESLGAAVFKKASPSVVLVKSKTQTGSLQGSGVSFRNGGKEIGKKFVPSSSWIVTNAHVVGGSSAVVIQTGNKTHHAVVKYVDETLDLALLWVPDDVIPPAQITNARKVAIGDRVFAIGSPLGLTNSISEGILSGYREYKGAGVVQTTAPISSGNSGGGLFDSEGRLIAITTFKLKSGESLNFAIDSTYVNVIMDANTATELIMALTEVFDGADEWKSNPSNLTRWLMTEKSDDGRPMYKYFLRKSSESYSSDSEGFFAANHALIKEIKDKYEKTKIPDSGSNSKIT